MVDKDSAWLLLRLLRSSLVLVVVADKSELLYHSQEENISQSTQPLKTKAALVTSNGQQLQGVTRDVIYSRELGQEACL
jgi:hypothetical protein